MHSRNKPNLAILCYAFVNRFILILRFFIRKDVLLMKILPLSLFPLLPLCFLKSLYYTRSPVPSVQNRSAPPTAAHSPAHPCKSLVRMTSGPLGFCNIDWNYLSFEKFLCYLYEKSCERIVLFGGIFQATDSIYLLTNGLSRISSSSLSDYWNTLSLNFMMFSPDWG